MRTRRMVSPGTLALSGIAAVLGAVASFGLVPVPVSAASPPAYTHSYYIQTSSTSAMQSLGASEGAYDSGHPGYDTVFLDFGQVDYQSGASGYGGYGAYTYGYQFVGDGGVGALVNSFAAGWYNATTSTPHLYLVVSLNNYYECFAGGGCSISAAGSEWGSLVNAIRAYLGSVGQSWQITVRAGDDAETQWDCYPQTSAFFAGFAGNDRANADMLDFGNALYGDTCLQGSSWSAYDVWLGAYQGFGPNQPFPEAYTDYQIGQW
jgi:hypothetical protein